MNKVMLMILDGWGIASDPEVSAIDQADTPFIDSLYAKYPHATLRTDGEYVGLPEGQMGNSEVGHMNLGAGRIVYQDLAKINLAIKDGTLGKQHAVVEAINYAKENDKAVHLLGLLSDGGVHSHIDHLLALIDILENQGVKDTFVHAFTDGRDVDPKSGKGFVKELLDHIKSKNAKLATVIGRYYAMDRDQRWERVKKAYDAIVKGEGIRTHDILDTIQNSYDNGITDEFIEPHVLMENSQSIGQISEEDVVIFFNFRTDRGRQLTQALSQRDFPDYGMKKLNLHYVTQTRYDVNFLDINVIYDKDNLENTLGEVLASNNRTQLRMAETEKYPHVTFFFSGGRESEFHGESRIMKPSPKVATYDLQPEMSAFKIKEALVTAIKDDVHDFICVNFANGDMVGHTGVMSAAIKACEAVDQCVMEVLTQANETGYISIVIADHGNCEVMKNPDGTPNTSHTTNPVPIILVNSKYEKLNDGILADIAPTILEIMGIDKPREMTGKVLV